LSELASIDYLSKYHFLRVFESVLRETSGHFLQRIRLKRAAKRLVYHRNILVTKIAHSCGFGSSQPLPRAFRSPFLTTPSDFRRANVSAMAGLETRAELDRTSSKDIRAVHETVRVIEQPSFRIAYICHLGR